MTSNLWGLRVALGTPIMFAFLASCSAPAEDDVAGKDAVVVEPPANDEHAIVVDVRGGNSAPLDPAVATEAPTGATVLASAKTERLEELSRPTAAKLEMIPLAPDTTSLEIFYPPKEPIAWDTVTAIRWGEGASFAQIARKVWQERGPDGGKKFDFREVARGHADLLLFDASRDTLVRIDLTRKQVRYVPKTGGEAAIGSVHETVTGMLWADVDQVDFHNGPTSASFVQVSQRVWHEHDAAGLTKFTFRELNRDNWSAYLRDDSRGVNVQLDLWTKKVSYSDASTPTFTLGEIDDLRMAPDAVARFAPQLRFDRAGRGYPMSAQKFFEAIDPAAGGKFLPGNTRVENADRATLASGSIPMYYQVRQFGNQVRIMYWWFYGYQHPCYSDQGSHNGDWERVMVTLTEDGSGVASVTYWQHNNFYTRIAGPRGAPCTPAGVMSRSLLNFG